MSNISQGDFLNASDRMIAAAADNPGEAVDALRLQLESDTQGIREAQSRRDSHRSEAQKASRDLDAFMASARQIYSRLRHLLIAFFGLRSEALVRYGIQPLRPPKPKAEPQIPPVEDMKKPPENGQSPTQAAHPQTESSS